MQNIALIILISGLALVGCSSPSALESDYGDSVKQMTEGQVYDRTTLTRPSRTAVEGADPDMINAAVVSMRTQATDRKDVSKPVVISIGGSGQ